MKYPDAQTQSDGVPEMNPEARYAIFQQALDDGQIAAVSEPGEEVPGAMFMPSEESVGPDIWLLDLLELT